jgi:membrane peptidoglycan carboxypeptidase
MSDYVERYGFGHPVAPSDFRGENSGIVFTRDRLNELALASMSIGYQVAVTPLQMLAAVSSIANGGTYIEPRVVRAMYRNNVRVPVVPNVVRRSVNPDTAATMTSIMEGVVDHGTGKGTAQIDGYTVAGKTGTAAKVINGRYSNLYMASFVGFLPSRHPELAIIVVIDSPRAGGYYGGVVSAPVFRRIAEAALPHLGIAPTINPNPPVLLAESRENPRLPAASGARVPAVSLVSDVPPGAMPDLRGLTLREATREVVKLGMTLRPAGDGLVVSQTPAPGTLVPAGSICQLVLARAPARLSASAAQP